MARKCKKLGCIEPVIALGYCKTHQTTERVEKQVYARNRPDYHRFYGLKEWKRLRAGQLARQPLCQRCLSLDIVTEAKDVDHIVSHKGDWSLFSRQSNLQSLCRRCHSYKTQQEAKAHAPGSLKY